MMKTNRTYTREFKLEAVELLRTSGKSAAQIERELGIGGGGLSRWKRQFEEERPSPDSVDMELCRGRHLRAKQLLADLRAEIGYGGVTPASVVERLDVIEHVCPRLGAGVIPALVDQFALQRAEEAFHRGIVVPASSRVHTGTEAVIPEQCLILSVSVLASLIRVVYEAGVGLALDKSHLQSRYCQITRHPIRHGPADDAPGVHVQDHSQVEPPFPCGDVCDVRQPLLIRSLGFEAAIQ